MREHLDHHARGAPVLLGPPPLARERRRLLPGIAGLLMEWMWMKSRLFSTTDVSIDTDALSG